MVPTAVLGFLKLHFSGIFYFSFQEICPRLVKRRAGAGQRKFGSETRSRRIGRF